MIKITVKFTPVNNQDNKIYIYTDGGCRSKAKKGEKVSDKDKSAYAFFLKWGGHEKLHGEAEYGRTNNYMELNALVQALKSINTEKYAIVVYSDSKYIVDSINKGWYLGWKRKGWKKGDGNEPANVELWKELDSLLSRFPFFEINHVKGHNGNEGNELVDAHLNRLMDELEEIE